VKPNTKSPANREIARLYDNDRIKFQSLIRNFIKDQESS